MNPETELVLREAEDRPITAQSEKEELLAAREQFLALETERARKNRIGYARGVYTEALNIFTREHFGLKSETLAPRKKKLISDLLLAECKKMRNRFVAFSAATMLLINYGLLSMPVGEPPALKLFMGSLFGALLAWVMSICECKFGTKSPFGFLSSMKFIRVKKLLEKHDKGESGKTENKT